MGSRAIFSPLRMHCLVAALAIFAVGCAQGRGPQGGVEDAASDAFFDDDLLGPQVPDPIEPLNRPIFAANMTVDQYFIDPISSAYGEVTPVPIKNAVRSVFANLNAPVVLVNEALQLVKRVRRNVTDDAQLIEAFRPLRR